MGNSGGRAYPQPWEAFENEVRKRLAELEEETLALKEHLRAQLDGTKHRTAAPTVGPLRDALERTQDAYAKLEEARESFRKLELPE